MGNLFSVLFFLFYIFRLFYTKKISLRTYISFIIGILISLIPLGVRNHIAFGKFWITGYSLINNTQELVGFNYLIKHFIPIAYEDEIEMLNRLIGDRFNIDKKNSIEISNLPALEFMLNRKTRRIPPIIPESNCP